MTAPASAPVGSDFAPLCRQIREAGLLTRRRISYAIRAGLTLAAFAGAWWVFVIVGDSWLQIAVALVLGVAFTQVAFLGHDAGHQQIARTRGVNDLIGLIVGDLFIGLSYGWWVDEHNQHHANPNHEGRDPDIGESVITFTDEQARERSGRVERFIAARQAWLFFPLLTLEGINLHVQAVDWLRTTSVKRYRRAELTLLTVHVVGLVGGVFLVLPPGKALVFLAILQAVWGVYMGCSFAPNHKGMPTIVPGEKLDFMRRQVLTSRNVRGGVLTDFALGGLNYQIEHHLFPTMPRNNLRRAQPLVRAHCARVAIPYTETSLVQSYAMVLRHLDAVGAPVRDGAASGVAAH